MWPCYSVFWVRTNVVLLFSVLDQDNSEVFLFSVLGVRLRHCLTKVRCTLPLAWPEN